MYVDILSRAGELARHDIEQTRHAQRAACRVDEARAGVIDRQIIEGIRSRYYLRGAIAVKSDRPGASKGAVRLGPIARDTVIESAIVEGP